MVGPCFWLAASKPKCLLPAVGLAIDPWKWQWRSAAILVVLIITGYGLGFSVVDCFPIYTILEEEKSWDAYYKGSKISSVCSRSQQATTQINVFNALASLLFGNLVLTEPYIQTEPFQVSLLSIHEQTPTHVHRQSGGLRDAANSCCSLCSVIRSRSRDVCWNREAYFQKHLTCSLTCCFQHSNSVGLD